MKKELAGKVEQLKKELDRLTEDRADSKRRLENIIKGLQEVLRSDTHEKNSPVKKQVREAVYHFESTHPEIAEALGRILSLLSNLGI